jgi:hypothetical protein
MFDLMNFWGVGSEEPERDSLVPVIVAGDYPRMMLVRIGWDGRDRRKRAKDEPEE